MTPDIAAPAGSEERLELRLFVAGDGPNSVAARANLKRLLGARNPSTYSVEIVDCLIHPLRAIEEGILVTPTLLRLSPPPRRTVVGSLSESSQVSSALSLVIPDDLGGGR
jgi:circadian clock protein KaiB